MRVKLFISSSLITVFALAVAVALSPQPALAASCDINVGGGVTPAANIQSAINTAKPGQTICVYPGIYNESAPGSTLATGGTYQFGLFFPASKPGLTLIGVKSSGEDVNSAAATLATINTDATNNFGTSGIFVEAANTTIRGVAIGPNVSGDNKTIEVIADNFTLKYSKINVPFGGSVYIGDFSAAGDVIKSYHIIKNIFTDGASVDVSNGAGSTGAVGGREIIGNTFNVNNHEWAVVSFNGSGTGVPWFVNTVGGAVIKYNKFTDGEQYIRARGTYDNTQFNWKSFWYDNTYNKAAIALESQDPFKVRAYSYAGSYGQINNVRRIGGLIQPEINNAVSGDTVLVKKGLYKEQIVLSKSLKLKGSSQWGTVIDLTGRTSYGVSTSADGLDITMKNFTVQNTTGANDGYGIKFAGGTASLENVTVKNSQKTEIDFNGMTKVRLENVVANGMGTAGAGVAFTDSSNVKIEGLRTDGNNWGGVALYTLGKYQYPIGTDNVTIKHQNSSEPNPLYVERGNAALPSSPVPVTNLTAKQFLCKVTNPSLPNFTWYQYTKAKAQAFAAALPGSVVVCEPITNDDCKNNGWKYAFFHNYKNQGDCVSHNSHHDDDDHLSGWDD